MSYATRRRLVIAIFIACVGALWLMMPRDASAQSRRRDRRQSDTSVPTPTPAPTPPVAPSAIKTNTTSTSGAAASRPSTPPAPASSRNAPRSNFGPSSFTPSQPPANATRTAYQDHFALLTQKNIFLKNRPMFSRTPSNDSGATTSAPPPAPEDSLILTGIELELGRPVAFIENSAAGTTERLTIGDAVARGTIYQIELDAVEYKTSDGRITRVEIGKTFTGAEPPAPAAAASTEPTASDTGPDASGGNASTAPSTPATAIDPNKANLSVEERMKLKRLQELKK